MYGIFPCISLTFDFIDFNRLQIYAFFFEYQRLKRFFYVFLLQTVPFYVINPQKMPSKRFCKHLDGNFIIIEIYFRNSQSFQLLHR